MKNFPKCKKKGSFPKSKIKSLAPQGKKGRVHSRRQKGQQGARKGQQGVAPCYLPLAGPLSYFGATAIFMALLIR